MCYVLVCMYMCLCTTYVCIYVSICVCVCVCMYVFLYRFAKQIVLSLSFFMRTLHTSAAVIMMPSFTAVIEM